MNIDQILQDAGAAGGGGGGDVDVTREYAVETGTIAAGRVCSINRNGKVAYVNGGPPIGSDIGAYFRLDDSAGADIAKAALTHLNTIPLNSRKRALFLTMTHSSGFTFNVYEITTNGEIRIVKTQSFAITAPWYMMNSIPVLRKMIAARTFDAQDDVTDFVISVVIKSAANMNSYVYPFRFIDLGNDSTLESTTINNPMYLNLLNMGTSQDANSTTYTVGNNDTAWCFPVGTNSYLNATSCQDTSNSGSTFTYRVLAHRIDGLAADPQTATNAMQVTQLFGIGAPYTSNSSFPAPSGWGSSIDMVRNSTPYQASSLFYLRYDTSSNLYVCYSAPGATTSEAVATQVRLAPMVRVGSERIMGIPGTAMVLVTYVLDRGVGQNPRYALVGALYNFTGSSFSTVVAETVLAENVGANMSSLPQCVRPNQLVWQTAANTFEAVLVVDDGTLTGRHRIVHIRAGNSSLTTASDNVIEIKGRAGFVANYKIVPDTRELALCVTTTDWIKGQLIWYASIPLDSLSTIKGSTDIVSAGVMGISMASGSAGGSIPLKLMLKGTEFTNLSGLKPSVFYRASGAGMLEETVPTDKNAILQATSSTSAIVIKEVF